MLLDRGPELLQVESLLETVHATAGVNQLLLAGVVRMAGGANFDADVVLGGTGVDYVAADASDGCVFVNGMNSVLHLFSFLSECAEKAQIDYFAFYYNTSLPKLQGFFAKKSNFIFLKQFSSPFSVRNIDKSGF